MKAFIRSLLTTIVCLGSVTCPARAVQPLISITLGPPETTVKAGHTIKLIVTAKILRATPFPGATAAQRDYYVDVRDSDGKEPPTTKYLDTIRGNGKRPKPFMIPPPFTLSGSARAGDTITERLDLTQLYDLRKPDTYTARVSRLDFSTETWVKSNTVTITVTAK